MSSPGSGESWAERTLDILSVFQAFETDLVKKGLRRQMPELRNYDEASIIFRLYPK